MIVNRKKIWIIVAFACIAIGTIFYLKFYSEVRPHSVTIATATPGGTFNQLGEALAGLFERLPEKPINPVKVKESSGSFKNVEHLKKSEANIAFAAAVAFVEDKRAQDELSILTRLYKDVLQIVVRHDSHIENINGIKKFFLENENQRIFVGPVGSSTRIIAEQVLEVIGLSNENYTADDSRNFTEAAERLVTGELKVAFFMSGIPTPAVQTALESDSCLLLTVAEETINSLGKNYPKSALEKEEIPANSYRNQSNTTQTIATWIYLICRRDIEEDLAELILGAIFDGVEELQLIHAKARDIKLFEAFDDVPEGLSLHPGAVRFRNREKKKLLIATGAFNGKYYQIGRNMQVLLEQQGIDARVVHTDGSLENLDLLKDRDTIAIVQYDAALASRYDKPMSVYSVNLPYLRVEIPKVGNIQRIAMLHEEKIHIVADGNTLADFEKKLKWEENAISSLNKLAEAIQMLPRENFRVCLGPENSASQVIAQAVLKHHDIDIQSPYIKQSFLSVSDMVNRLQNKETDLGFFTSYVPSEAMLIVLQDRTFRLLSLGAKERTMMTSGVFTTSEIDQNTYASQYNDEPVQTLATKAVLVTTDNLDRDVAAITKAIFDGEAYLGIKQLAEKNTALHMPSLPLHPDAERYYRKAKLIPPEVGFDWLDATWTVLACLVILTSGYRGLIMLRRSRTGNRIARRILAIPLEAASRVSAQELLKIRDEIQGRVRSRWWQWGELDKHRWQYLADLIQQRMNEAKENHSRSFVAEIRSVANDPSLSESERLQNCQSIEDRILEFFERGELDASQQKILRELIQNCS